MLHPLIPCPPGAAITKQSIPATPPILPPCPLPPISVKYGAQGGKNTLAKLEVNRDMVDPLIVSVDKNRATASNGNELFPLPMLCVCLSSLPVWQQQKMRCLVYIPSQRRVRVGVDLCSVNPWRVRGQDHDWDLPISSWDLGYKLMVEWWYGLGMKCLA